MATVGGDPTTVASTAGFTGPAIAVDATNVYFTASDYKCCYSHFPEGSCSDAGGSVIKVPRAGGTPIAVASGLAGVPHAVTVDPTSVYWTVGYDVDIVMKVPLAGGKPTTLASVEGIPASAIAVDATSVYWTTGSGLLLKAPLDGLCQGGVCK